MRIFREGEIELTEPLTLLISREKTGAEKCQAGLATIEPGASLPAKGFSQHPTEEISYIISGTIEVETEEGSEVVREGDIVFMDPDKPHKNTNIGDKPSRVLWFVAPPTLAE